MEAGDRRSENEMLFVSPSEGHGGSSYARMQIRVTTCGPINLVI